MSTIDLIKLAIVGPLFFVLSPALGAVLKGRKDAQLLMFGVMCFMTINGFVEAGNWGLTLGSIETYRGHTRGYHFYYNHALAIALIVAKLAEDPKSFRFFPPGLLPYVLYCLVSLGSIVNAPQPGLVLMAAHKMLFATLIMLATFNVLRTSDDLRYFLKAMAVTMSWQVFVVLKLKYANGMYQVRGTFEHQNPLAMYCILIGMVFLATALGPGFKGDNFILWAFLACGIVVQCTLSRAALAAFAAGTMGVMVVSLLEKATKRRVGSLAVMGMIGAVGLALTLDTIVARFNDQGNTASSELRHVMNHASREMAADYKLGIGWNNYALVVNPPFKYADVYFEWILGRGMKVDETKPNAVVESHYYLLLGETGWPGLGLWLFGILLGLWRNFRAFLFFGHSFHRCLALGIGTGCALNYGQSLVERVLVQPRNLMLWLILLGVTARLEVTRRAEAKEKRLRRQAGLAPAAIRTD